MNINLKFIFKLIVTFILLLIFIFTYVTDVWDKFHNEATTFTTKRKPIEAVTWPAMTVCIENALKSSILKEKAGTSARRFFRENTPTTLNTSLWDLYYEAAYKLDQDFRMEILTQHTSPLHLGNNTGLFIEEFPTKFYGLCYSLTGLGTKTKEYDEHMIIGVIPKQNLSDNDPPTGVSIFFTSPETRHNVITQHWPFVNPLSIQKKFAFKFMVSVDLHQIEWKFYEGNEKCVLGCSIQSCMLENILEMENSCPHKCIPVIQQRLFPNSTLPHYHSIEDNACMYGHIKAHLGSDPACEKPQSDMQYVAFKKVGQYLNMADPGNAVYVLINHKSKYEVVKEEIRIYDTPSLIGSIGGTLGLFIGFSFL